MILWLFSEMLAVGWLFPLLVMHSVRPLAMSWSWSSCRLARILVPAAASSCQVVGPPLTLLVRLNVPEESNARQTSQVPFMYDIMSIPYCLFTRQCLRWQRTQRGSFVELANYLWDVSWHAGLYMVLGVSAAIIWSHF